jgi:hypothetical protein
MSDLEKDHSGGTANEPFKGMGRPAAPDEDDRKQFEEWWAERTLPVKILTGIGFAILGIGLLALAGLVVMLLWNWLMPDLFGLKNVNYWQAWGLLILSSILFKGINFGDNKNRTERKRKRELRRYLHEDQEPVGGD